MKLHNTIFAILGLLAGIGIGLNIPLRKTITVYATVTKEVSIIAEKKKCDEAHGDFMAYNTYIYDKGVKSVLKVKCNATNVVFDESY